MPRVCWRCEGRGLLRHNTTTKDGKYLLGFIPCFCAKGKRIAAERAKNTEQLDQPDTEQPTIEEEPDHCRAAHIDCLDQMARTPKSAVSPDFIAAIDDGRKALGEG